METLGNRLAAPLGNVAALLSSGIGHLRWWLDWQTRPRAALGARPLDGEREVSEDLAA
jgi:hypothetical protein